jgi:hypothetical protein
MRVFYFKKLIIRFDLIMTNLGDQSSCLLARDPIETKTPYKRC